MAAMSPEGVMGFSGLLLVLVVAAATPAATSSKCAFPAIYSFGDSTADTGELSAALGPIPPPNGMTYFKHPTGRLTDGRVMLDFIAAQLGLPFLSAYLDSIGTSFKHGANFATAGASILPGYASPFHLPIQVNQYLQFKGRTSALYNGSNNNGNLPNPQDFPKALYTFDIGQNDLIYGFQNMTEEQVISVIPSILDPLTQAIEILYNQSARAFLVYNVGPIGCNPFGAEFYRPKNATYDKNHCVVPQNDVVQEYNKQLKDRIVQLRQQLSEATITYIDIYTEKYSLIDSAKNAGFGDPWSFCCGLLSPTPVFCGTQKEYKGRVIYGGACPDPSKLIYWDGMHYSDAANQIFAQKVIKGSVSDPSLPIDQACGWSS